MELVESITIEELQRMAEGMYDDLVKAVIDVENELLVVDAGMHSDEELLLLENGSKQEDLWGINLYPEDFGTDDFIEFDSMINIRPAQGNRSRGVEDDEIKEKIIEIVSGKVHA